jgi:class 3 adenylate cyclase/CHASE2 domain-containing sensor protein
MEWVRGRDALAALAIALVAGTIAVLPPFDLLHGWSIDALTALRWRVFGNRYDPAASPAVVVALDEETYKSAPFQGSPTVVWTREIGRVITALVDGGARVIGLDVVFPTAIEQSKIPFGDDTLGARLRGFDRDFLRAIALAARAGKLVLGEIMLRGEPIFPHFGQLRAVAVDHDNNLRSLNLKGDADDVVRRVPLTLTVDGKPVPGLALELAARTLGVRPQAASGEAMTLAGYRIPSAVRNTLAVNFEGGAQDIPTYSLADLRACVERGDTEFFRRHFAGKAVIIGVVLEAEDRQVTSKRFATAPEGATGDRCVLPPRPAAQYVSRTIPGPYIHATAINNLIRRDALIETGPVQSGAISVAFAAMPAFAALLLPPVAAAAAFLLLASAWTVAAVAVFQHGLVLPLLQALFAGMEALFLTIGFRLAVTDKDRRFLRRSFALYLAPAVIEKMMASSKLPSLGGETRNVTMFFSDVEGFTSFAETMAPAELIALMNVYLSAMTDIIESHGGFVDKYIGDAIVGVFGAPVQDEGHASQAVLAALACCDQLIELSKTAPAFRGQLLRHRIGLNSGEALVGNVGSGRRFNYTVIGDVVNLASRLEGANKYFGTSILASETSVALTGSAFAWREIDAVRVIGRAAPLRVYEPLAPAGKESAAQYEQARTYAEALACWRKRDFNGAAELFASIADVDPPSALFMQRAKQMLASPPGPDWKPIYHLQGK